MARFDRRRIEALTRDPGIVRNRLKIESTVSNARAVLEVQKEFRSLDAYLWTFVGGAPIVNRRGPRSAVPASTSVSDAMGPPVRRARAMRDAFPLLCPTWENHHRFFCRHSKLSSATRTC